MSARIRSKPALLGEEIPVPKGRSETSAYVEFKLEWLWQVATSPDLPPVATAIAVVLATEYLNRKTLDAWPAIETLAGDTGRSPNAVRAALHAISKAGLMKITTTRGGKGQMNHYRPTLIPSKKREGWDNDVPQANPPNSVSQTLQKTHSKPSKKREGNPLERTLGENPGRAPSPPVVPPARSSSTTRVRARRSTMKGSGARDRAPTSSFRRGDYVEVEVFGLCEVDRVAKGGRLHVRSADTGDFFWTVIERGTWVREGDDD